MGTLFAGNWAATLEPCMQGLKRGGLMNQSLEDEASFRQGRHHFMTAVNQMIEWELAIEQVSKCLQIVNIIPPLNAFRVFRYVVPSAVAYLASLQIEKFRMSEAASYVQSQLSKLSLLTMTISTVALFRLGQPILAATTLTYLTIGALDRYNILPASVQRINYHANFIIGNLSGLYLGGNLIRMACTLNLVIAVIKKYFNYRHVTQQQKIQRLEAQRKASHKEDELLAKRQVSLDELRRFTNESNCRLNLDHIQKNFLPIIREDVRVEDLLDLYETINWDDHETVIKAHLAQDKRWIQNGQFEGITPLEYFKRNLTSLVKSIGSRQIKVGKPQDYETLIMYGRYIAQQLPKEDLMTQADCLIQLGIDAGKYCGPGIYEVLEGRYHGLLAGAHELPLEERILACLQQERLRIWQRIYSLLWNTHPVIQLYGHATDPNAVHNINLFINLTESGPKFGIPAQAARNDQTAMINPLTHYFAYAFVDRIRKLFWRGGVVPQHVISLKKPEERTSWKVWTWLRVNKEAVSSNPYDKKAIMESLETIIGQPQLPKPDIYSWWTEWIQRQQISDKEKDDLMTELMYAQLLGEPIEVDGKIQHKFLLPMLIEMGILNKPIEFNSP